MTADEETQRQSESWLARLPFGSASKVGTVKRQLKLVLDVPQTRGKPLNRKACEQRKGLVRGWSGLTEHPVELLRKIEQFLKKLNTEKVPAVEHSSLLEHVLQYACPAIRKIYAKQYPVEALPESHDRREGLVVAANVCAQLAIGYKLQLLEDFSLADKVFTSQAERVRGQALRVMELTRIEQRLRAMRHQKLPRKAWVDCNRLYFVLASYEDVTRDGAGLNCLLPEPAAKVAGHMGREATPVVSLQQSFLAIHLFGLIDCNSLSSHKMHIADMQLARILGHLQLRSDHAGALAEHHAIIYYGQDGPAYFRRCDEKAARAPRFEVASRSFWKKAPIEVPPESGVLAVTLDLSLLNQLLSDEYRQLMTHFAQGSRTGPAAPSQTDLARLLVVDTMRDGFQHRYRQQGREYTSGEVLHVYHGFMSVFTLLNDGQQGQMEGDQGLRDLLARQSALISEDAGLKQDGDWLVLDKNAEAVHLRTRESQFTHAMFIGQLVAFVPEGQGSVSPCLAYVARLSRDDGRDIEVTLRILSIHVRAGLAQNSFLSENEMAMPILYLADGDAPRLLLHQSHRLPVNTALRIEVAGETMELRLSKMLQLQREFIVYSIARSGARH